MTEQELEEYRVWEVENNRLLKEWYNTKLPTMPYYTPTKEQLYVGMECEKRIWDWDVFNYEICCSGYACHIYALTPSEELNEHCQHIWKWAPHILTEQDYNKLMLWTGDYRNSPGMPLNDIRIKKYGYF